MSRPALVITSIAAATPALEAMAAAAVDNHIDIVIVGDADSPPAFELDGCDFYSLERQRKLPFELALACPEQHYARKNIGYLIAMQWRAPLIVETDDDTVAYGAFWAARTRAQSVKRIVSGGWVNAYRYFTDRQIWPRGLPLDHAMGAVPAYESLASEEVDCPIQQGLIDEDPDVDAIYRMLFTLPFRFERRPPVAFGSGTWCPFNSQNTTWWRDAYPLMYLPATCSFRMTDIWRSFVAQRIAWANGWSVLFHEATMRQVRNPHDLTKDFADEVPGHLANREICEALASLDPIPGTEHLPENMRRAYELLVGRGCLDEGELSILDAWLADIQTISAAAPVGAVA